MKVSIYNQQAQKQGDIDLSAAVFGVKPSKHLLAEVVRVQQMNSRSARPVTKTRAKVSGGGRKPWKQKGTGRARAGSTRSPIWRHGGVALGPSGDRNWHRTLNRQVKRQALLMALSDKVANGKLIVLEGVSFEAPKTKAFVEMVQNFRKADTGVGKKPMFILPKADRSFVLSSRNIKGVSTSQANSLSPLDIVSSDSIVLLKDSVATIEAVYGKDVKK